MKKKAQTNNVFLLGDFYSYTQEDTMQEFYKAGCVVRAGWASPVGYLARPHSDGSRLATCDDLGHFLAEVVAVSAECLGEAVATKCVR